MINGVCPNTISNIFLFYFSQKDWFYLFRKVVNCHQDAMPSPLREAANSYREQFQGSLVDLTDRHKLFRHGTLSLTHFLENCPEGNPF